MRFQLTNWCPRNLMARDEPKNLGFADDPKPKPEREKGVKGELQW